MTLLQAEGVVGGYARADMILKGVSIRAGAGEIVAILGPNGAGKSTFLKAVAGQLKVREGTIKVDGAEVANLRPRQIAQRGVAYVPQEANVFPSMTVRENLEMGGYLAPRAAPARIEALFQRFPILAEKRREAARALSGGQRQILAVAIALMVEPKLLLLDEPSAGLSPVAAAELFATIRRVRDQGVGIVLVEQNALEALDLADRAYILAAGQNHIDGKAAELARDADVRRAFLGG
jgi:branched-chain amino acid transport system ATP-binding protein/neutral amino acid transport system ATP-binding protein